MEASSGPSPCSDEVAEHENKIEAFSVLSKNDNEPLLSLLSYKRKTRKETDPQKVLSLAILLCFLCSAIIAIWIIFFVIADKKRSIYDDGPPGLFGEWPVYGGNLQNQQISPNAVNITMSNIHDMSMKCSYESEGGQSFDGYIVIDDNNNAYFSDYSGHITCVNLDICNQIWRKSIAQLLGYGLPQLKIVSRNSVTLYIDNATRRKSVLLATPNKRRQSLFYPDSDPCWLLSLDARTGDLIWKLDLSSDNRKETYLCHAHGFIVDNEGIFAYGGLSFFGWRPSAKNQNIHFNQFKGRLIKVALEQHEIVDEFYTIPATKNDAILRLNESENGYIGGGIWNFPAMIDSYIVFGSGDLSVYPDYINDCFKGISNLNNSYDLNPCGENQSDYMYWKCLENDIFIDSLIVLNVSTFELVFAVPLQGVDAWNAGCEIQGKPPPCPEFEGTDSDLAAVSVQKSDVDGIYHAFAHQKNGMFYMVEIPSGQVLISKKVGPWSSTGGANSFSLAISTLRNIAIASISGGLTTVDDTQKYKYATADNNVVCETGSVHAIDLNTGYTLFQIINPFGRSTLFNNSECRDIVYDEYVDWSMLNGSLCERAYDNTSMLPANETCSVNNESECVIYPAIMDNIDNEPVKYSKQRGKFYGGITIVNDMIFIPSISGDIFVHNLLNGSYIHRISCPTTSYDNRPAIGGGVTVVSDRIVFYCGRRIQAQKTSDSQEGNQLISMQLNLVK